MEYLCSLCGEKHADLEKFIDHTDAHIVEVIKQKHPDWAQEDGICPKCLEYYRKQIKGEGV